ncbi:hypothetical protein AVEN_127520-1 [Araneus ventricosus]|uniref:Uncharacterized protein n=1 Tax=Araneus ventricosus TaxID=182803 RepID=A0A4Y2MM76_ARAVE|nr:hypothetical protein AVEN_127520-1 [Araneus ventricosus]
MVPNNMSLDDLRQYFLSLTSFRERKSPVESLSEILIDLGKENQPPDYIELKNSMYDHLLAVEYERAMKLQKKILSASDASRPTFSALSTKSRSPIHTSADESDQDSLHLVKSKKTKKKCGSTL